MHINFIIEYLLCHNYNTEYTCIVLIEHMRIQYNYFDPKMQIEIGIIPVAIGIFLILPVIAVM